MRTINIIILITATFLLANCTLATKGNLINKYPNPKKALLVMDIQKDFTSNSAKMPVDSAQASNMISNLNKLLEKAEDMNLIVIYIGNEFEKSGYIANLFRNNAAIKGSIGAEMDQRLKIINKIYFSKNESDALSSEKLNTFLIDNHVNELFISGLFADGCVYWTARGALNRNYIVNIVEDCIATDCEKSMRNILEKYKEYGMKSVKSVELKYGKNY
ncbi:MAG: cysteine hydrolase [Candidatus Kapabacteria bacterium]|nr:cysteine hydrolase [Candidatus Kapabacteria bacterium]